MTTLYIDSNGTVRAHPDKVEPPVETSCYKTLAKTAEQRELCRNTIHCACDWYDTALQSWKEATWSFEEQSVKYHLPLKAKYLTHHEPQDEEYLLTDENRKEARDFGDEVILPPDTLLQAELPEYSPVRQFRKIPDRVPFDTWKDCESGSGIINNRFEYRTVLRFTDKQVTK